jgi:superoxide reductase
MKRRDFFRVAMWGGALMMLGKGGALAKEYYPVQVDETLWQGINRVKNSAQETGLEKLHSPVIKSPAKVKAGEVFPVEVAIGKIAHPMEPTHWIEYLQLNIGNEPAGNAIFRSRGYLKAEVKFNVRLVNVPKGETVSLVAQIKCNLHGIWQNYTNVEVV